jgi:hypothetical protein
VAGVVLVLLFEGCTSLAYWFGKEEVVVLRLHSQVLEYRIGPEALHEILQTISTGISLMQLLLHTQLSI